MRPKYALKACAENPPSTARKTRIVEIIGLATKLSIDANAHSIPIAVLRANVETTGSVNAVMSPKNARVHANWVANVVIR
jgi:hypothetical protein